MQPAAGTTFERFGGAKEIDAIEALLAGYATDNDTVKEAAFQAFINGDKPVQAVGRQVIARLAEHDPWIAAEFSFNLMAESQNSHYGVQDNLNGLHPDDCWDMAATSLPRESREATYMLAKGFCILMDQERSNSSVTLAQYNRVARGAVRNGCAPEVLRLFVRQGFMTIQQEDERLVNEDRRRVEMLSSGLGVLGHPKDVAAAARLQAKIDAHKPGEYVVDRIRGTYEYSDLNDYKFSELLIFAQLAGIDGDEEITSYLSGIFQAVLPRLDGAEVGRFVPEIIDTYVALGPANQAKLRDVLAAALHIAPGFSLEDITETKLQEFARSCRDERYSYEKPDSEYYKPSLPADGQRFWPGDVVELVEATQVGHMSDHHRVIKDVNRHIHDTHAASEDEAEKYYEVEGSASSKADSLQLVERGELWKYCHGDITEFSDPKAAYDYVMRTVEYQFVNKRDLSEKDEGGYNQREFERWIKDTVLEAIERGYADGFKTEPQLFVSGKDIVALKFNDPKIAELIANTTLRGFGRQPRQAVS